jgi:hypothetical protein
MAEVIVRYYKIFTPLIKRRREERDRPGLWENLEYLAKKWEIRLRSIDLERKGGTQELPKYV